MLRPGLALGLLLLGVAAFFAGLWWGFSLGLQQAHEEGLSLWQLLIGYQVREPFWAYAGVSLVPIALLVILGLAVAFWGYTGLDDWNRAVETAKKQRADNAMRVIAQELGVKFEESSSILLRQRKATKPYRFKDAALAAFTLTLDSEGLPFLEAQDDDPSTVARVKKINARLSALSS